MLHGRGEHIPAFAVQTMLKGFHLFRFMPRRKNLQGNERRARFRRMHPPVRPSGPCSVQSLQKGVHRLPGSRRQAGEKLPASLHF